MVALALLGEQLDLMTIEGFSSLSDSMILWWFGSKAAWKVSQSLIFTFQVFGCLWM